MAQNEARPPRMSFSIGARMKEVAQDGSAPTLPATADPTSGSTSSGQSNGWVPSARTRARSEHHTRPPTLIAPPSPASSSPATSDTSSTSPDVPPPLPSPAIPPPLPSPAIPPPLPSPAPPPAAAKPKLLPKPSRSSENLLSKGAPPPPPVSDDSTATEIARTSSLSPSNSSSDLAQTERAEEAPAEEEQEQGSEETENNNEGERGRRTLTRGLNWAGSSRTLKTPWTDKKEEEEKKRQEDEKRREQEERLAQNAQKCMNILKEILATETDYVQDLGKLETHFLTPLRAGTVSFLTETYTAKDIEAVFGNIETLRRIHSDIEQELQVNVMSKIRMEGSTTVYDQVFEEFDKMWANLEGRLKAYGDFSRNSKSSNEALLKCLKHNPFVDFVEKTRRLPEVNRLQLQDFLIKPIQRICKYPLFLRELLRIYPDNYHLQNTLARVENVARQVNEARRAMENVAKLDALQEGLEGCEEKINVPGRKFLREGVLLKSNPRGQLDERQFFLFNDAIMYAKIKNAKKNQYQYKGSIPLSVCLVQTESHPDTPAGKEKCAFQLYRVDTKRAFLLIASSEAERDSWIKEIDSVIKAARRLSMRVGKLSAAEDPNEAKEESAMPLASLDTAALPENMAQVMGSLRVVLGVEIEKMRIALEEEARKREEVQNAYLTMTSAVASLQTRLDFLQISLRDTQDKVVAEQSAVKSLLSQQEILLHENRYLKEALAEETRERESLSARYQMDMRKMEINMDLLKRSLFTLSSSSSQADQAPPSLSASAAAFPSAALKKAPPPPPPV